MNAQDLADEAEKQSSLIYLVTEKQVAQQLEQMLKNYATMLRQQQDTIQKLSERIKWLEGASKLIRGQTND